MSEVVNSLAQRLAAIKGTTVLALKERDGAIVIVLTSGHKYVLTQAQLTAMVTDLEGKQPSSVQSPGATVGNHPRKKKVPS